MAGEAHRRRGRKPCRGGRHGAGNRQRLLPGTRGRPRRFSTVRRQRRKGARARLQRAMERAIQAKSLALWRGSSPCPARRGSKGSNGVGGRARNVCLLDQRPRLGRLHGAWGKRDAARDQSPSGRHARYFRQCGKAPPRPSSRRGDAWQAAAGRAQPQRSEGLRHRFCPQAGFRAFHHELGKLGSR